MRLLVLLSLIVLVGCGKDGINGKDGSIGPTGASGQTGSSGTSGTNGTNGTDGLTISNIVFCTKIATRLYEYNTVTFSTGDKHVFCSVTNGVGTYSSSITFKSTQAGATTESCLVTMDVENSTSGWWNFTKSGTTKTTVYSDATSASNGTTVTFATSDCTTVN